MKNLIVQILVLSSLVTGAAFAGEGNCQKGATSDKKVLAEDKTKTDAKTDSTAKQGK
jgi:hypothetical protein